MKKQLSQITKPQVDGISTATCKIESNLGSLIPALQLLPSTKVLCLNLRLIKPITSNVNNCVCLSFLFIPLISNLHPYCISLSRSECRKQTKCSVPLIWLLPHFENILGQWSPSPSSGCIRTALVPKRNTNVNPTCTQSKNQFVQWLALAKLTLLLKSGRFSQRAQLVLALDLLICCLFLPKVNILHIRPLSRVRLLEA